MLFQISPLLQSQFIRANFTGADPFSFEVGWSGWKCYCATATNTESKLNRSSSIPPYDLTRSLSTTQTPVPQYDSMIWGTNVYSGNDAAIDV
jgi:hypothetical protein